MEVLVAGADYRPRRREITSLFCFQQQHLHAASAAAAHLQRKRPTATKTSQLDRARPSNLNTNSVFRARGASVARCLKLSLVELRCKQLKIWQRWPIFAEPTFARSKVTPRLGRDSLVGPGPGVRSEESLCGMVRSRTCVVPANSTELPGNKAARKAQTDRQRLRDRDQDQDPQTRAGPFTPEVSG